VSVYNTCAGDRDLQTRPAQGTDDFDASNCFMPV
jgi:hypothetical protein